MPHKWEVIKEAIFTERTTALSENENTYTFKVHPKANKMQIKEAVERSFQCKGRECSHRYAKAEEQG